MYRWVAFLGAVSSLVLLTSGVVSIQWLGWLISSISCLAWIYFARQDRDTPRMLMEMCYFIASLIGVINWLQ